MAFEFLGDDLYYTEGSEVLEAVGDSLFYTEFQEGGDLTINKPTLEGYSGATGEPSITAPTLSGTGEAPIIVTSAELIVTLPTLEAYAGATAELTISSVPTLYGIGYETDLTGAVNLQITLPLLSGFGGGAGVAQVTKPTLAGAGSVDIVGKGVSLKITKPTLYGVAVVEGIGGGINMKVASPSLSGYGGGVGSLKISKPTLSGIATVDVLAVGNLVINKPTLSGVGTIDVLASGELVITAPVSLYGLGNLTISAPVLSGSMSIAVARTLIAYAMNLKNGGITPYNNYPFDYLLRFRGQSIGLGSTGAYLLDGENDNGTKIDAFAEVPPSDFGVRNEKRCPTVYVGSNGNERVVVSATVDEDKTGSALSVKAGRNKRAKLARGLKGVYWGYKISNINGGPLDIDGIEVVPEVLRRKV